ncbi:MAG: HAD hydrolase-like protein [Chloroflexi bacterium]|nr:HAD hydrolase-like protein [Chloroflexota bacterium]
MDGVLWHGNTPLPGLVEFFDTLRRLDINFALATNNAAKTATMYSEKLKSFGVEVAPEQIVTASQATASYLHEEYPAGARLYTPGAEGLRDALTAQGFTLISQEEAYNGAQADAVVVGFNPHATYQLLAMGAPSSTRAPASSAPTPTPPSPVKSGRCLAPALCSLSSKREPASHPPSSANQGRIMFQQAVKRLGGTLENSAMVGDRLTTDILGGKNAGLHTILVLSGISNLEDVKSQAITPDYIFADITELAAALIQDNS